MEKLIREAWVSVPVKVIIEETLDGPIVREVIHPRAIEIAAVEFMKGSHRTFGEAFATITRSDAIPGSQGHFVQSLKV